LGHANGHNLIAISGVAAAIGLATALKKHDLAGRVILLATPAHELDGGKISLLRAGAYKTMDACLMVHPGPMDTLSNMISMSTCEVTFIGKEAHSGHAPWEGVNALDAAVQAYTSIGLLRQQIPPEARIHAFIGTPSDNIVSRIDGNLGTSSPTGKDRSDSAVFSPSPPAGNLSPMMRPRPYWITTIPSKIHSYYAVRSSDLPDLQRLKKRIEGCLAGAALATECEWRISWNCTYFDLRLNRPLGLDYARYMQDTQQTILTDSALPHGSTDFANVSYEVPCLHTMFNIGCSTGSHTAAFARAARSREAHVATLRAAKGIATTALRLISDTGFAREVKEAFETDKRQRARFQAKVGAA